MVGPTNFQPSFLSVLESAMDSGVVEGIEVEAGRFWGSNDQKKAASEPCVLINSWARLALLTVASILPRWRTMPSLSRRRLMSFSVNLATLLKSKLWNAWRNAGRLVRMVRQLSPD